MAGADDALIEKIGAMAQLLGPMFQIMDDVIDLTTGKGREAGGSDIAEGKRSFMVAHAAAQAAPSDTTKMFDILDKPRELTTRDDIEWVALLFERCGAMDAARLKCEQLHEQSALALEVLPPSLSGALGPVIESLVSRTK